MEDRKPTVAVPSGEYGQPTVALAPVDSYVTVGQLKQVLAGAGNMPAVCAPVKAHENKYPESSPMPFTKGVKERR